MNKAINTAKLIFIGIFFVAAAGIWAYQIYWVRPKEKCEDEGGWWSMELRQCRQPVALQEWDPRNNDKLVPLDAPSAK